MDLDQFMDYYGNSTPGPDLAALGVGTVRLGNRLNDADLARSLIATLFWQAFLYSEAYDRNLQFIGASAKAKGSQTIIVPRPALQRFDLLVLDPGMRPWDKPKFLSLDINLFPSGDSTIGARNAATRLGVPPAVGTDFATIVREVWSGALDTFGLLIAGSQGNEPLNVPGRAISVKGLAPQTMSGGVVLNREKISTVGAFVECRSSNGIFGVTAALHALGVSQRPAVDTQTGTLIRSDKVTDSAFIELSSPIQAPVMPVKAVMSGITPRANQLAAFNGATSKRCQTIITGWNPEVPNASPRGQALIYTRRDAQPGDSGAALVTDDDYLVGFGFERSLPSDPIQRCSWVWASSVLRALNVRLA